MQQQWRGLHRLSIYEYCISASCPSYLYSTFFSITYWASVIKPWVQLCAKGIPQINNNFNINLALASKLCFYFLYQRTFCGLWNTSHCTSNEITITLGLWSKNFLHSLCLFPLLLHTHKSPSQQLPYSLRGWTDKLGQNTQITRLENSVGLRSGQIHFCELFFIAKVGRGLYPSRLRTK